MTELRKIFLTDETTEDTASVDSEGRLSIFNQNHYYMEIAKGNISNHTPIRVYGHNPDIDTTTDPEDLWSSGGLWVAPTTARIHNIVSTSGNDTNGGTGANAVFVDGLDSNFDVQTETVTMNGTNNVATNNSYTRINFLQVVSVGTGLKNSGLITATAQTDSTITCDIEIGDSLSHVGVYTVPNDKTAYILNGYLGSMRPGSTSAALIELDFIASMDLGGANRVEYIVHHIGACLNATSNYYHPFTLPMAMQEKTDLIMRISYVSDNNMDVTAGIDLVLVDN